MVDQFPNCRDAGGTCTYDDCAVCISGCGAGGCGEVSGQKGVPGVVVIEKLAEGMGVDGLTRKQSSWHCWRAVG
jgi:hypothetical protein